MKSGNNWQEVQGIAVLGTDWGWAFSSGLALAEDVGSVAGKVPNELDREGTVESGFLLPLPVKMVAQRQRLLGNSWSPLGSPDCLTAPSTSGVVSGATA